MGSHAPQGAPVRPMDHALCEALHHSYRSRQRATVASVIIGVRNEEQLRDNLGAVGWTLSSEDMRLLDEASAVSLPYPFWHHAQFPELLRPSGGPRRRG